MRKILAAILLISMFAGAILPAAADDNNAAIGEVIGQVASPGAIAIQSATICQELSDNTLGVVGGGILLGGNLCSS